MDQVAMDYEQKKKDLNFPHMNKIKGWTKVLQNKFVLFKISDI